MSRFACAAALALGGLQGALAGEVADCKGNATCPGHLEDESLMQLGRLGVQAGPPSKSTFARNSRPYHSKGKGLVGAEVGRILIDEDGVLNEYYLPGATTIDGGRTVKYTPPYRFYLMKSPTTDYSNKDNFYMPSFPGKTFSVDIDFKRDGPSCGCNLNFYLVGMPWPTAGKDGDYYCDAQCFPDMGCCSEFDMNEGNMAVQQITNHACTGDYNAHPEWQCNKWGDPEVKTHPSDFNAGDRSTVDSSKPFTFSQRFDVNGDDFTFTTTISQGDRNVIMRMGPGSSQLNAMLQELRKGMAFVTGYWYAQDMNWMDGEVCGSGAEHCNMHPAYISNWRITSNGGAPSPPAPSPPAPVPSPPAPEPTPDPSPGAGQCCWGRECTECKPPGDWCNQSPDNCWVCTGGWCKA